MPFEKSHYILPSCYPRPSLSHIHDTSIYGLPALLLLFSKFSMPVDKTLYSFVVPKILKKDLERIGELFLSHLLYNFQFEEYPFEFINRVREEYREIDFAKTADRSVLGSMNELRFQYEYEVFREGGIDKINMLKANQWLNGTIMGALKYAHPVDAMRNLLQG